MLKEHNEKTKDGQVMSKELKENGKKVDEQLVRLIMKWYVLINLNQFCLVG